MSKLDFTFLFCFSVLRLIPRQCSAAVLASWSSPSVCATWEFEYRAAKPYRFCAEVISRGLRRLPTLRFGHRSGCFPALTDCRVAKRLFGFGGAPTVSRLPFRDYFRPLPRPRLRTGRFRRLWKTSLDSQERGRGKTKIIRGARDSFCWAFFSDMSTFFNLEVGIGECFLFGFCYSSNVRLFCVIETL